MALADKVQNDIGGYLRNVLQGYTDHINRCEALIAAGVDILIEDNNTPQVSRDLHVDYVAQLTELLINAGILQGLYVPVEALDPQPVIDAVKDLRPDDAIAVDAPAPSGSDAQADTPSTSN